MQTKITNSITIHHFLCLLALTVICLLSSHCKSGTSTFPETSESAYWRADEAPQLISPENGAILDNGRIDFLDKVIWDFDWLEVTRAPFGGFFYELNIIGPGKGSGEIYVTTESSYHFEKVAHIIEKNRFGWRWRVRARNTIWLTTTYGPWSEERTFDVEPLDTDPPSNK